MIKPWLWLPPKLAHDLSPYGLKILSRLSSKAAPHLNWNSFSWTTQNNKTLLFKNPLGIAGGVDKDATSVLDWQNLGAGFIEVGTVTLLPQLPNSGKIIDRDIQSLSLWNKMGFPSLGSEIIFNNISALKSSDKLNIPLFINLGKNRTTPNEKAHLDYCKLMTLFQNQADAFVINISSPNTQGLRNLAQSNELDPFLNNVAKHHENLLNKPPVIMKLSPDLTTQQLSETVKICLNYDIDGFILTNTTLSRFDDSKFPIDGGISGKPLKKLSLKALDTVSKICSAQKIKKIIISTGGVMTADDVFERIDSGSDLIQVYSTLVFNGPYFFRKVAKIVASKPENFKRKTAGSKSDQTTSR